MVDEDRDGEDVPVGVGDPVGAPPLRLRGAVALGEKLPEREGERE